MFDASSDYCTVAGRRMHELATELFPLCRSLTGEGIRSTLKVLSHRIPLEIVEIRSGTKVLDWEIPDEWNIRDAYIANAKGEKLVKFAENNLHVVGYSSPVNRTMSLEELRPHLHSLPDRPDWIPYRTAYFDDSWGFCLSHNQLQSLEEGDYHVVIDASLQPGSLSYGELLVPGELEQEILLSAHACHPSLANDNLSGISLLLDIGEQLLQSKQKPRYSYRLLFAPGTIGAIAWLARNEDRVTRIASGLVLSCVGDSGGPLYKRSRRGDALIDRAMAHVLSRSGIETAVVKDFWPYGYDERQYCSPGFNLPVGLIQRSQYGEFPEYHTSADNLDFITAEDLGVSLSLVSRALNILERDAVYYNTNPKGEPQLGRRGLYNAIGGDNESAQLQLALLWVLNLSDGAHSVLDIANRAGISFELASKAVKLLRNAELLEESRNS